MVSCIDCSLEVKREKFREVISGFSSLGVTNDFDWSIFSGGVGWKLYLGGWRRECEVRR